MLSPSNKGKARIADLNMDPAIREVRLERVFNLGNYETLRIGYTAVMDEILSSRELLIGLDECAHNAFEAIKANHRED